MIEIWKPKRNVVSWDKLHKVYIDIETSGLNIDKDRIYFIGLFDGYNYVFIHDGNEKKLLLRFLNVLSNIQPDFIIGHNIFSFDLPFIIKKCEKYNINIQKFFWIKKEEKRVPATDMGGKPLTVMDIRSNYYQILDTMVAVARWDFVNRKLPSYNLKDSVIELGLRDKGRIELDNPQIVEAWKNKNYDLIMEYLRYDLIDTYKLSEYLHPLDYYQLNYLPSWITPQMVCLMGNASKWEAILEDYYLNEKGWKNLPDPDEKIRFEGAIVEAYEGLYKNVGKVDVASLYPNIMLRYDIHSRKDEDKYQLRVLKYLTTERLKLKTLAKQGNKQADLMQNAMKVLINSAYGFLGTANIPFNDMQSAQMVTKKGQEILTIMKKSIIEKDGILCELDTDGLIFAGDNEEHIKNIYNHVQSRMPEGFEVELEFIADACYVANKKNYVVFINIDKSDTWIYKGTKFRGRDKSMIEKDFPIKYVWYYAKYGIEEAEKFYKSIFDKIENREIDINYLIKERRIRKGEKQLRSIGNEGDKVKYLKLQDGNYGIDSNYDVDYYLEMLRKMKAEINKNLGIEQFIPDHFYKFLEYCKNHNKDIEYRIYANFCRKFSINKSEKLLKEEFENIMRRLRDERQKI